MASDGGSGGRIIGIVLAVAIGAGVVWWKFGRAEEQSVQAREQVAAFLAELPDYPEREALYTELLDAHHERAFDAHHRMGGRASAPSFNGEAYLDDLFTAMIADAEGRGETQCAEMLRALRADLAWDQG